jgi:hypothetical protein
VLVPGVSLGTERLPAGGILRPAGELRVVGQLGPAQLRVHHAQHQDGGGGGEDGHDDEEGETPPSPEPVSLRLHVQVLQNMATMVYFTAQSQRERKTYMSSIIKKI